MKRSHLLRFSLLLAMALGGCSPAADSTAEAPSTLELKSIPNATEPSTHTDDAPAPTTPLPGVEAYRQGDYAAALRLLQGEAEGNAAEAQFLLGELHFHGRATPRNYAQARHWLQRAAEQGHPEAQHRLAEIHAYGYGVPRDAVVANRWEARARANDLEATATRDHTTP